ncbi:PilZ domain-containing protein [Thiohalobacter sp. IOR34]|uniref:PilZ domain-containing protein n=1 Tax=Thiohalobacter sp. IOR34 TaxID=3057176 RepID=UPI0025B26A5C|nr:PilZ domain-containing protein [Thiohalobacter sp. IOR34]WJW75069.1 PilZ domain-containing protein [Thiohalobacter sp. IOR34]
MAVEHRWSERKPIQMEVALHYPPVGTLRCTTRDVSLEGMFVATDGVELPPQAELEISFVTEDAGHRHEHRMPAYVVHGNGDGVGLMLRHVDYHDFYALRHLLSSAA